MSGCWSDHVRWRDEKNRNRFITVIVFQLRSSATYSLNDDGTVKVINCGRKVGSVNFRESVGKAKIADPETNAKLKVSFFRPFYGNYWVLDRGDDYDWAIVGEPSGRYLWVLTREARPAPSLLASLEARVKALGYDWSLVRVTKQNGPF